MVLSALAAASAEAGVALYQDPATGTPWRWRTDVPVQYAVDPGKLGRLSPEAARALVAEAAALLTNVPSAAIVLQDGDTLPGDVTSANWLTHVENCDGKPAIIFDDNGRITEDFLGRGAACDFNGFGQPTCVEGGSTITDGYMVLNGSLIDGDTSNCELSENDIRWTAAHELGHLLNLGHSDVNGTLITYHRYARSFEAQGTPGLDALEVMHYLVLPADISQGLHPDDVSWLTYLYPASDVSGFSRIVGTVTSGSTGQSMQGVQVVARAVDAPYLIAISAISGQDVRHSTFEATCGYSTDAARGAFEIPYLPPGHDWRVNAEEVQPGATIVPCYPNQPDYDSSSSGVFLEFFSGALESGDPASDDPNHYSDVSLASGMEYQADIQINGYASPYFGDCQEGVLPEVDPSSLRDGASARMHFQVHNTSERDASLFLFDINEEDTCDAVAEYRESLLDWPSPEATGILYEPDESTHSVYSFCGDLTAGAPYVAVRMYSTALEVNQPVPLAKNRGIGILLDEMGSQHLAVGGFATWSCLIPLDERAGLQIGTAEILFPLLDIQKIDVSDVPDDSAHGIFDTVVSQGYTVFGNGGAVARYGETTLELNTSDSLIVSGISSLPDGEGASIRIGDYTSSSAGSQPLFRLYLINREAAVGGSTLTIPWDARLEVWSKKDRYLDGSPPTYEACTGLVELDPGSDHIAYGNRLLGHFDAPLSESGTCPQVCESDLECDSGTICDASLCTAGCRVDSDCARGLVCEDKQCIESMPTETPVPSPSPTVSPTPEEDGSSPEPTSPPGTESPDTDEESGTDCGCDSGHRPTSHRPGGAAAWGLVLVVLGLCRRGRGALRRPPTHPHAFP